MAVPTIEPVIHGRSAISSDRSPLIDVYGQQLADVGVLPRLGVQAAVDQLRRAADGQRCDPAIFARAARLFAEAELDGQSVEQYVSQVVRGTGLPAATVQRAIVDMVAELAALPRITESELPAPLATPGHRTRWVPAGGVFAAIMASNHPLPHSTWVQALFVGYSVAVRPGSRDPFTPGRLIAALLAAGLPAEKVALLPCTQAVGSFLLRSVDRGIIYGDDAAVRDWRDRRHVTTRGPGRSRALLDCPLTETILDHLVTSAAYDGGTRCTNLSAVLTSGPVAETADRLAARLAQLPVRPAMDPTAQLLVVGRERADAMKRLIAKLVTELGDHSTPHYGGDFMVDLGDGSFLPRPIVLSAEAADHAAVGMELGFPFVVVAPWTEPDGVRSLSPALVLNLLTDNDDIRERAIADPGIRKITCGTALPWELIPGIPHDGNYSQFLLEPKGIIAA
ncbi:aldehyde dehydrogenase family protein [Nocardia sp. NPDC051463]|uniref:aldehyde dehydrogenase family protein n=1 Tax=Nocardia sp. NPDC051463 TaxID=3154845 RepID=UPI00343C4817